MEATTSLGSLKSALIHPAGTLFLTHALLCEIRSSELFTLVSRSPFLVLDRYSPLCPLKLVPRNLFIPWAVYSPTSSLQPIWFLDLDIGHADGNRW